MKIGVFLPGRLSSERLPNKLILPLGESNLWDIACKKLNDLPKRYNKYALCEDKELVEIAEKYPNIKVIKRDPETALAEGPLNYIFKDLSKVKDSHLMFLNPCLSFLQKETIIWALDTFAENELDYATSVKHYKNWIFTDNGMPLNTVDYERLSTKEIEPLFVAAHAFHIFNKDNFFEDGLMLKEGHAILSIPEEETFDVNTKEDYNYVKWTWENILSIEEK